MNGPQRRRAPPTAGGGRQVALVYRGPASVPGCPEAVAALLRQSRWDLDVRYVGPREVTRLSAAALRDSALYVQPGGGQLRRAYRELRRAAPLLRAHVASGGRYLGVCLGAYLAGRTPGFALLPGDTDRYIGSPGATVTTDLDTVIDVVWGGTPRQIFFQDGPWFDLDPRRGPAEVLAVYDNGLPAAVVAPYGQGAVGAVGPHPEASPDWFTDSGLRPPARRALDLGLQLLDRVMLAGG